MQSIKFTKFWFLTIFFSVIYIINSFAGNVTGIVKDANGEPLIGVSIAEKGTAKGTITDFDGKFSLSFEGNSVQLVFSYVGYKSQEKTAKNGDVLEIVMEGDALSLNEVVVTGSSNPRTKLESSVAISTLSAAQIESDAPISTASLLQNVPGFLVESSGGQAGNNLFARGIPSAGAYEYVQFQEDGLPVFEDGALQFANIDNFQRVDATISKVEAVKGGSASIYATGAPGGIINFISKTGQNELGGKAVLSIGDYGLFRSDVNLGGAIVQDKLFFNVGGFYRVDGGIRRTGYNANDGGQFKSNLTYNFKKGSLKVFYKHLNDRTVFYQSTPFVLKGGKVSGVDGFDPNFGTFSSSNYSRISVPQAGGTYFNKNLEDGIHPISDAIGTTFKYYISDKVSVNNSFKATKINQSYNAIFAAQWMGDVSSQATIAKNLGLADGDSEFTYNQDGSPLASNVNLKRADFWNIEKQMGNFANNLAFNFDLKNLNLNVGFYYSNWQSHQNWNWSSSLVTVSDDPQLVNLKSKSTGTEYTYHGITGITWLQRESQLAGLVRAPFADAEYTVNKKLTINVGLRYDFDKYSGSGDHGTWGNNLNLLANNNADNGANILTGKFVNWKYDVNELSYTGAVNYKINDNMATYLRYSRGFRAPIEESFYFAIESGKGSAALADLNPTTVNQVELGYKFTKSSFAIFANAFLMNLGNIAYQDIQAGGVSEKKFANVQNIGLELEVEKRFKKLNLRFIGTIQNPQYKNYEGTNAALNGNVARRISKFYCTFRPEYSITNKLNVYASYQYFGKKFQDIENKFELPGFGSLAAGASYQLNNVRFAIDATNLTNAIGLTEADGLQSGLAPTDGQIFMARSILGRSLRFSVGVDF